MMESHIYLMDLKDLSDFVQKRAKPGDIVVSLPDYTGRRYFYFCTEDNIGPEIKSPSWSMLSGEVLSRIMNQKESEFKVGDIVITSTGQKGVIEEICDCEMCMERGFLEPVVRTESGVGSISITYEDKKNGFRDFYKIGDHKFGNIDMEYVTSEMLSLAQVVESSMEMLKGYTAQLKTLQELKD